MPGIERKIKYKGKEQVGGAHKKAKTHKVPPVYNLTNEKMDRINYQVWDAAEEVIEEAIRKHAEQHQKVHDQLVALQ
jgi:hypothetical protein